MNDDATLTAVQNRFREVRGSIADVRMDTTASDIFARATRRRRRRVLAAAGTACAALGLTVALAVPGGQAAAVHVHLAAWSVDTHPNGTVTFKLRNTSQPARLQHVLAEAGVPAMVRWGEICLAQGRHVLLPTQGIVKVSGPTFYVNGHPTQPGSVFLLISGGKPKPLNWSWTITPAKIPQGARFVISAVPGGRVAPHHVQAEWEFVPASAHVTCATSVKP
jgi:hypothetical protein